METQVDAQEISFDDRYTDLYKRYNERTFNNYSVMFRYNKYPEWHRDKWGIDPKKQESYFQEQKQES